MGYARWLHLQWPAGKVEPLPEVNADGSTAVPGLYVVGDLRGIPLLKLAADSGAKAVATILADPDFSRLRGTGGDDVLDVAIVGGGVSGISAALAAKKAGLRFRVYESASPFSTVTNFPVAKPIFVYPTDFKAAGEMKLSADVKEKLVDELEEQRKAAGIDVVNAGIDGVKKENATFSLSPDLPRAHRVIVAIGRSGKYRILGVPGETQGNVSNRLHDPKDYAGKDVVVVGGGDSALEAAIALTAAGARVTLLHRGKDFARAKPENVAAAKGITTLFSARVTTIGKADLTWVDATGKESILAAEQVFTMIGREAPLDFFRKSGVPIRGEWSWRSIASFVAFLVACTFVYNWKSGGDLTHWFEAHHWFPFNLPALPNPFAITLREPGFYYSLAYTVAVVLFGLKRIRKRRTPYITVQTLTLIAVQTVPLFFLPYFILPYLGHQGLFDHGLARVVADNLFPQTSWGQGREYWRAFGFILAWPLFIWNFFTPAPMTWWLVIGCVQTFVIIPAIVWRWGKGAYCGFICSCGALAETLGDDQRQKMPHGPIWNRLNFVGQAILVLATLLFIIRAISWTHWGRPLGHAFDLGVSSYYHGVDIFLAGIVGVGFYFWFSGRVWCRFACPLAALMHVYARFSAFRIFAEKKKCISCNVCTSVCHQGIDVMAFANKGLPMEDPECVRCSACVQSCPTGTLSFGRVDGSGAPVLDRLAASPVLMAEGKKRLPLVA